MNKIKDSDLIDFGPLPDAVNDILQRGVLDYRQDRESARARFHEALALDPTALPIYFCLYKIHAYQGHLDDALDYAEAGLAEAARQAGMPTDWRDWSPQTLVTATGTDAHFALYTLKALAFIHLRRDEPERSEVCLAKLQELGQIDAVGGTVIADLARALSK